MMLAWDVIGPIPRRKKPRLLIGKYVGPQISSPQVVQAIQRHKCIDARTRGCASAVIGRFTLRSRNAVVNHG